MDITEAHDCEPTVGQKMSVSSPRRPLKGHCEALSPKNLIDCTRSIFLRSVSINSIAGNFILPA